MENQSCCAPDKKAAPKGWWQGILYGLLPHTFCILFVVFSVVGSAIGAAFVAKFMMIPYFFQFLIGLSLVFATLSAIIYLRRLGRLNWAGARVSWKYLTILFALTIGVNTLMFFAVFPAMANMNSAEIASQSSTVTLKVSLPCPGHAPLITQALTGMAGIQSVKFVLPDRFIVGYDAGKISEQAILSQEIFKSFTAKVISN